MQSKAKTVAAYLAELPEDRRAAIQAVRRVILDNLDPTFKEGMLYGMIGYYVPHEVFPAGYHCDPSKPLGVAGLASQKQAMSLYHMALYGSPEDTAWFVGEWKKTGKKLDMGKSCIRFKKLEDLPLDLIGRMFKRYSAAGYIKWYEASLAQMGASKTARAAAKKTSKTATTKSSAGPAKKTAKKAARKAAGKIAKKSARKAR